MKNKKKNKTKAEITNRPKNPWDVLKDHYCGKFEGEYCGCWIQHLGAVKLKTDMSPMDCLTSALPSKKGYKDKEVSDTQHVTKVGAGNCGCGSSSKSHRLQHEDYLDNLYKRVFADKPKPKGVNPTLVTPQESNCKAGCGGDYCGCFQIGSYPPKIDQTISKEDCFPNGKGWWAFRCEDELPERNVYDRIGPYPGTDPDDAIF